MSNSKKKDKEKQKDKDQKEKGKKEEIEIVINFLNEPSELGIRQLNQEWLKILREMERDGRLG